jgi:hypothetical protein
MSERDLLELHGLHDRWLAIDSRGTRRPSQGLAVLPNGAVVVDHDPELDRLCLRIAAREQTSLSIVFCGRSARARAEG